MGCHYNLDRGALVPGGRVEIGKLEKRLWLRTEQIGLTARHSPIDIYVNSSKLQLN